jgi:uncharacterized membrane protein
MFFDDNEKNGRKKNKREINTLNKLKHSLCFFKSCFRLCVGVFLVCLLFVCLFCFLCLLSGVAYGLATLLLCWFTSADLSSIYVCVAWRDLLSGCVCALLCPQSCSLLGDIFSPSMTTTNKNKITIINLRIRQIKIEITNKNPLE